MRIQRDNIVIRSATIDDAVQLNKWWNDTRDMVPKSLQCCLNFFLQMKSLIRNVQ